ncbi:MAG: flagellar biosynthesis anti-sigma factor FlgM [Candidatus Tectomicrobia bacterium]|nr:flagellar biosynthesis anti-sigma factor FlgM [Candidatus Tectomicrobia bacterium]
MARNRSHQDPHRIDGAVQQEKGPESLHLDSVIPATGQETIALPSKASAIQQAREVVGETPELRYELVIRLQNALQVGTLMLDSHLLAEKLIGIQFSDVRPAA